MSNNMYLYVDLFLIIPLSITMSFTRARTKLSKYIPKGSLICVPVLSSVIG